MRLILRILTLIVFMVAIDAHANKAETFPATPVTNNGEKWNIGYYQGGDFISYNQSLIATVQGLMDLGWIEKESIPQFGDHRAELLWEWLSTHIKSPYINFMATGFYSSGWDQAIREANGKKLIHRLSTEKDIDLMIAMGTWAGKDLANDLHGVRTIIMSTSDPVYAGIIKSNEDSGLDHIHARVDPLRFERQISLFYEMVGFEKLGLAFENTVEGRSYAAIDTVEKVAREKGFEVVKCFTLSDIADQETAGKSVIGCFEKLAGQADAIYITEQGGVNAKTIPKLVSITLDKKIPTFSQQGADEVRQGVLLSISKKKGFKPAGRHFASLLARIFNGAKPRELNQVFEDEQSVAMNIKTAEIIGFYLHADIIAAVEEIYRDIE